MPLLGRFHVCRLLAAQLHAKRTGQAAIKLFILAAISGSGIAHPLQRIGHLGALKLAFCALQHIIGVIAKRHAHAGRQPLRRQPFAVSGRFLAAALVGLNNIAPGKGVFIADQGKSVADYRAVWRSPLRQGQAAHLVLRVGKIAQRQPAIHIDKYRLALAVVPRQPNQFRRAKHGIAFLVIGHVFALFVFVRRAAQQGIG